MKNVRLAGLGLLAFSTPAMAQTEFEEIISDPPRIYLIGDIVVAKGTQRETVDQAEVIDVILPTAPEGLTLAHPAEILNTCLLYTSPSPRD